MVTNYKIIVATYLYPKAIKYVSCFLNSINFQSNKSFKLYVFNDEVMDPSQYFKEYKGDIEFVMVSGTPASIRFQSFEFLGKLDSSLIVFQDIDDEMTSNRVEVITDLLTKYDFVCNDLTLLSENGDLLSKSIWSERLIDGFEFNYEFIKDKNILGIGNSGIKNSVLKIALKYSKYPKVADWFMFYQLLANSQMKAVFTTRCQTLYRQHDRNIAGIREFTAERLSYVIEVKKAHYKGLAEIGLDVSQELEEISEIEKISKSGSINTLAKTNLYWWEETKYINN